MQPHRLIYVKSFITVFLNKFGNILIPYFTGSDICHKSNFCLQNTVTECILNFIYWTPQPWKTYHFLLRGGGLQPPHTFPKIAISQDSQHQVLFYTMLLSTFGGGGVLQYLLFYSIILYSACHIIHSNEHFSKNVYRA